MKSLRSETYPATGMAWWKTGLAAIVMVCTALTALTQPDNRMAPWLQVGSAFPAISLPSLDSPESPTAFPPDNGRPTLLHIFGSW